MAPISEEQIENFMSFTAEPFKEVAEQFLDHCGGNVEQAMNLYFDDTDKFTRDTVQFPSSSCAPLETN